MLAVAQGSSVLAAVRRIFGCGAGTPSCGVRDLVPWPGIKPRPQAWECRALTTASPGKSNLCLLVNFPANFFKKILEDFPSNPSGLCYVFTAKGMGSIPCQGTGIPQAVWYSRKGRKQVLGALWKQSGTHPKIKRRCTDHNYSSSKVGVILWYMKFDGSLEYEILPVGEDKNVTFYKDQGISLRHRIKI